MERGGDNVLFYKKYISFCYAIKIKIFDYFQKLVILKNTFDMLHCIKEKNCYMCNLYKNLSVIDQLRLYYTSIFFSNSSNFFNFLIQCVSFQKNTFFLFQMRFFSKIVYINLKFFWTKNGDLLISEKCQHPKQLNWRHGFWTTNLNRISKREVLFVWPINSLRFNFCCWRTSYQLRLKKLK